MAYKQFILVCGGTGCESSKADLIFRELQAEADKQGVSKDVQIVKTGCFGFCEKGPIVKVLPTDSFYVEVKPEDAKEIISEQIVKGREVKRLLYNDTKQKDRIKVEDIEFYQKQFRIVLRNCGIINPESIDEYIARDGYVGLERTLFQLSQDEVIAELKASGLRGRGGAGFPTWRKWEFSRGPVSDQKYVVCNADEGDPGAYMDRSTVEGDPHSVIEAMTICGHTIGASKGYVYIRAEYPLAIERLRIALDQAREYGLLGDKILGSDFSFDIEIRLGAGAFVCGEETALLQSIEGNRGMPIPRPPFPAIKGLWGKPTVINNVETWANIPVILSKGADWFNKIGTETSKGTKVFALTGKVKNSGLVEVPMGTTLREIVYEIGGGIKDGKKFLGAQTGGPSGGILTSEALDIPIDYESLAHLGSMMGSGGLIVMDEDDCVVDVSKFYMEFCVDESCGKCSPCRIGTNQMHSILQKISKGLGTMEDLDKLEKIGHSMKRAALCGLGQTAPNPTLSTLKRFREEYEQHIVDKKCRSGKCKDLVVYSIDKEKCIGCGLCARRCPVNCISGDKTVKFTIDQSKCIKCGECFNVCKFGAVLKN